MRARTLDREPPRVKILFDMLVALDDLLSFEDLCRLSKISRHDVGTALDMLVGYKAIERIVEADGKRWYMATPDYDQRQRKIELRKPEEKKRNVKPRKKLPTLNLVTGEETP